MTSAAPSKIYSDDVSLVVVLLDVNPLFWAAGAGAAGGNHPAPILPIVKLLNDVISFLNSLLLMNQLNQVVLIASGVNSCGYIYDSSSGGTEGGDNVPEVQSAIRRRLDEFVERDGKLWKESERVVRSSLSSLLSGSLSLALCYIQRVFRSGTIHPQPRVCIIIPCWFLPLSCFGLFSFHHDV
ncbi:hypothetical protein KSP39_PZI010224 [Platanthera zijinensis]|uniref:General transcription and DNA repair factor IIH subunit TFB4 n=1 Tax=Platanthera zijinensis TaxID=2320716 RepID=A0AAP0BJD0_9ASPA